MSPAIAVETRTTPPTPPLWRETTPDQVLRVLLVGTALFGFTSVHGYNRLPMPATFDALIAVLMLVCLASPRLGRRVPVATYALVAAAYLIVKVCALTVAQDPAPFSEFLRAYKAYIFLFVLAFFVGRQCFTREALGRTVRLLLVLAALKYGAVVLTGGRRPGLWTENNFELMTLIGLTYLAFFQLGPRRSAWVGVLAAITLLSGSRSGVIELGIVLVVLYLRPSSPRFLLHLTGLVATLSAAGEVFAQRMHAQGDLAKVDRYRFFELFLSETSHWGPREWLFGSPPLTPLSDSSCARLSYYQSLMTDVHGDEVCYSVVLHMYALRALFDQGILGTAFLLALIWRATVKSRASRKDSLVIVGIGLANALSVSSFNSEWGVLPLVVLIALPGGSSPRTGPIPHGSFAMTSRGRPRW